MGDENQANKFKKNKLDCTNITFYGENIINKNGYMFVRDSGEAHKTRVIFNNSFMYTFLSFTFDN